MLAASLAPASAVLSPYQQIRSAAVLDPRTGAAVGALDGVSGRALVLLLPQLGEFDSAEMAEFLVSVDDERSAAGLDLRVIGIGDAAAARRFCDFTGLSPAVLRVDPTAATHRALGLHAGPGWTAPEAIPDAVLATLLGTLPGGAPADPADLRPAFDAPLTGLPAVGQWLNYLAMCAGFGAPGTLREILRGYFGDKSAPERLSADAVVRAGPVEIGPGVGPVKIGPLRYSNWWKDEAGYQRPVELATVRLRNMVEVLTHWDGYVSNPATIAQRGATFVFDADGAAEYEYRHRGVLTYSETMARPLSFLAPYIGDAAARDPLRLADAAAGTAGK